MKVLVVVDVQNDFITGSLRNEEAIKKVPNIVNKIRNFKGDKIIVTRDTHYNNYLNTKEGEKLAVEHCIEFTEGWELEKHVEAELQNAEFCIHADSHKMTTVTYIQKPTFGSLELADIVSGFEKGTEIEVVGFCTDICVVSNALILKAALYDKAEITVDASCCAGVTKETHKAALETMKMCQINVINEDEE